MKPRLLLFLFCLVLPLPALLSQDAWVRQVDLTSGLVYDHPLESDYEDFLAALPVSEQGSLFELYARGTAWDDTIYLLDSSLIRAYAPAVTVQLVSEDDYARGDPSSSNYVRRTRADRPFSLTFTVSGLVPGSEVDAQKWMYFGVHGRSYDTETYSAAPGAEYSIITEANVLNGTQVFSPLYHELAGGLMTQGCGEQLYTFIRYAADGVPDTILARPKIEIWPVATAAIENVTAGQVFIDRIPSIIVRLDHLYPDSRTYVQIYSGTQVLGKQGTLVNGTERRFGRYYNPELEEEPTNVPQTLSISMEDLSNYASTDGIYTLEVITETPYFNRAPERLLHVTFEVDRTISSRGQLTTAERSQPLAEPLSEP